MHILIKRQSQIHNWGTQDWKLSLHWSFERLGGYLGAKNSLTSTATAPQTGGGKPCPKHNCPNPMHQAAFGGYVAGVHHAQHRLPSIRPGDHIESASESSVLAKFCNPGLCGTEVVCVPGAFWRSASESSLVLHLTECHLRQWPQIPASACGVGCHLSRVDRFFEGA